MMDTTVLLTQLGQLGRQLEEETTRLGELDMLATGLACDYNRIREEYEDELAAAFLSLDGPVEARKMASRQKCVPARLEAQDASRRWEEAKSRLRTQQAAVRTLQARIEIGRSMLSHEKTLMGLGGLTP